MTRLDRLAILVIAVSLVILAGIIQAGSVVPVIVSCQGPGSCTQIGPYGSVVFEFSRPVVAAHAEASLQTDPKVDGRWEWTDDSHALWHSTSALLANQKITFQFSTGRIGKNGERIRQTFRWEATVRQPEIVFVKDEENAQELYVIGLEENAIERQLTHTDHKVFDYTPSPEGDEVAFSVMNDQTGYDLWIVQRDGANQRKVLDCGADRCSTPAWSPVSREIAYSRESAGLEPKGPKGAPRIWMLDLNTGQTTSLFSDPQKIGYGPQWSPDGKWLAIWDGTAGGIQVVNRSTGDTILLNSSNGDTGCWARSSTFLFYSDMIQGDAGFHSVLFKADITQNTISTVLGGSSQEASFSMDRPVCSPTEDWVVVTTQESTNILKKQLFLLNPDGKDGFIILDDPSKFPNSYSWTPEGDRMIIQLDQMGGKMGDAEVWVWDRSTNQKRKLISSAKFPKWLP